MEILANGNFLAEHIVASDLKVQFDSNHARRRI